MNKPNSIPDANNNEINRILGRQGGALTGQIDVKGVNPQKINCEDLLLRGSMSMTGRMVTPLTAANGLISAVGIRFATVDSGFYSPAADVIGVAISGVEVCEFSAAGVGLSHVYALGGLPIDFGGATIQNAIIIENPNAFTIVGAATQTGAFASVVAVTIPIALTSGTRGVWELQSRVIAIEAAPGSSSGTYAFTVRATAVGAVITLSAQYDININLDAALVGISVAAIVVGTSVQIRVTGNALTLRWQGKTELLKVESS